MEPINREQVVSRIFPVTLDWPQEIMYVHQYMHSLQASECFLTDKKMKLALV